MNYDTICQTFIADQSIDPITKQPIEEYSEEYYKYVKLCKKHGYKISPDYSYYYKQKPTKPKITGITKQQDLELNILYNLPIDDIIKLSEISKDNFTKRILKDPHFWNEYLMINYNMKNNNPHLPFIWLIKQLENHNLAYIYTKYQNTDVSQFLLYNNYGKNPETLLNLDIPLIDFINNNYEDVCNDCLDYIVFIGDIFKYRIFTNNGYKTFTWRPNNGTLTNRQIWKNLANKIYSPEEEDMEDDCLTYFGNLRLMTNGVYRIELYQSCD